MGVLIFGLLIELILEEMVSLFIFDFMFFPLNTNPSKKPSSSGCFSSYELYYKQI